MNDKEELSIGQNVWVRGAKGTIIRICGLDIFVRLSDGRGMFFPRCVVKTQPSKEK